MLESLPGAVASVLGVVFLAGLALIIGVVASALVGAAYVPIRLISHHHHRPISG